MKIVIIVGVVFSSNPHSIASSLSKHARTHARTHAHTHVPPTTLWTFLPEEDLIPRSMTVGPRLGLSEPALPWAAVAAAAAAAALRESQDSSFWPKVRGP